METALPVAFIIILFSTLLLLYMKHCDDTEGTLFLLYMKHRHDTEGGPVCACVLDPCQWVMGIPFFFLSFFLAIQ